MSIIDALFGRGGGGCPEPPPPRPQGPERELVPPTREAGRVSDAVSSSPEPERSRTKEGVEARLRELVTQLRAEAAAANRIVATHTERWPTSKTLIAEGLAAAFHHSANLTEKLLEPLTKSVVCPWNGEDCGYPACAHADQCRETSKDWASESDGASGPGNDLADPRRPANE